MKKKLNLVDCTQCGARLSHLAEACPECGYPHLAASPGTATTTPAADTVSAQREYRILQFAGIAVLLVGLIAAGADSRFAAAVAMVTGALIYLAGLLGSWWNRDG